MCHCHAVFRTVKKKTKLMGKRDENVFFFLFQEKSWGARYLLLLICLYVYTIHFNGLEITCVSPPSRPLLSRLIYQKPLQPNYRVIFLSCWIKNFSCGYKINPKKLCEAEIKSPMLDFFFYMILYSLFSC